MDENLQITQSKNQLSLTSKQSEMGKVIYNMNLFYAYPLNDDKIAEWVKALDRLIPDLDVELLSKAMDRLIMGRVEFNHNIGIINIFNALESFERRMVY